MRALVTPVQTLVQTLFTLIKSHPPQGGLLWVVRRQFVVGPESGLSGAA